MDKLYKLLSLINENKAENQRELAVKTKLSIGTVNALIKNMEAQKYINVAKTKSGFSYSLTKSGLSILENMMLEQKSSKLTFVSKSTKSIDTAVILAAGKGQRLEKPAGLLEISETTVIDKIIDRLKACDVTNILLVVGYKAQLYREHFKNSQITFVENPLYERTGTMHSLSLVKDAVKSDFLLVESDQLFEQRAISELLENNQQVSVLVSPPQGSGDEAYVEFDAKGNIFRIAKDVHQLSRIDGEMLGISKIPLDLFQKMLAFYENSENPFINYEYVMENIGRLYNIKPHVIDDLVWCEIDNPTHYKKAVDLIYPRIKRRETEMRENEAKEVLKEILSLEEKDIESVTFVGGLTNTNYKVKLKKDEYILRIPGKGTEFMIQRATEKFNGKIGSLLGINCGLVYFNEKTGVKLSEYSAGAETLTPKTARIEANFKKSAKLLKRLHTSGVELSNRFDVFEEAEKYEKGLKEIGGSTYGEYDIVKKDFLAIKDRLENKLGLDILPCHNDLVAENFVKDKDGRMYLIDWEYSGMNDPAWDLAAFLLESSFSQQKAEVFLEFYYGEKPSQTNLEKILCFMICQDFLWALWTNIKEAKGVDYGSYGIDRYNRCREYIKILYNKFGR